MSNQPSSINNRKLTISYQQLAIVLRNVSKRYTIHHEKPTLVERVVRGREEEFYALKNINLTIKKGEKVGIIGHNGSGKTTLLKLIAGITTPTSGTVKTYGKLVSLIDLQAGFHPDLTGEQNIYLNGMLIGMTKQEIQKNIQAIIQFADIGKFIDTPMFTYSTGMTLRLGFAVAVHANPDILVLDENISAGDTNFRKKSEAKIQEFFKKGKTIIVVSHNLEFIEKNCIRVIHVGNGNIVQDGRVQVITTYQTSR